MAGRRSDSWEDDFEVFNASQVESLLDHIGVEAVSETNTHFLCLCPFHGNTDTPALAVDKTKGLWTCFNPGCARSGTMEQLIRARSNLNPFEAARLIIKHRNADIVPFADRLNEALTTPPEFVSFPQGPLDRMYDDFWQYDTGQKYMLSRHFTEETLRYFRIGYSSKQNMVVVPMHAPDGMLIGFIGRSASHTDKRFKNTDGLPKSKTAYNFHRAKKEGETVVVVEASFDAMRVHQAGYPNVVALLGGYLSPEQAIQLNRTFSRIIIMTDFDVPRFRYDGACKLCRKHHVGCRPGRVLGQSIASTLSNKKIMWATYSDECVFPYQPLEGYRDIAAKDAGDMTDEEIRHCLKNAISNFEYQQLDFDNRVLPWEPARGIINA